MTALSVDRLRTSPGPKGSGSPGRSAAADSVVRSAAGVAMWVSLGLVSYWWASGGGITDLAGRGTGLTSLGRLSGLVASDLLLVQVLLIARIPLLEKAFGHDRLLRHHRIIGFTSFNLMLAHVVLISWGYAAGSLAGTPGTLWNLVTAYPGMLLAAGGTFGLVLSVVTSIRAARKRLRYESWHLLHLYTYLGVGLALPHQLWTGQEFLSSRAATLFWWSFGAVAAGAVLMWRVVVPLVRSARHRLRVTSVVPEGEGVFSVYMTGRDLHRLTADAGQFFTWRFLGRQGWTRGNPYSLSAAPDGRSLRISIKRLGTGSTRVASLRPGTRVLVEGPYGRLSARARARRRVALFGAGVGVAPLRALAEGLEYGPGEALFAQRFTEVPLFAEELQVLRQERGLDLLWLPGHRRAPDSWLGEGAGTVDDLTALTYWVPDIADRDVYVCGPEPWVDAVRRTAGAAGVPAGHIHVEYFRW